MLLLHLHLLAHQRLDLLLCHHQFFGLTYRAALPVRRCFKINFGRLLPYQVLQFPDSLLEFDSVCVYHSVLFFGFVKLAFDYAICFLLDP